MKPCPSWILAACFASMAATAQPLPVARDSDPGLDCQAIQTEQQNLKDTISAGSSDPSIGKAAAAGTANVGGQLAGAVAAQSAGIFGSLGGLLSKAAGSLAQQQVETRLAPDAQAVQLAQQAKARSAFLTRLSQARACRPDDASFAGNPLSQAEFAALSAGPSAAMVQPLATGPAPSLEVIDAKHLSDVKRVAVASFVVQYVVAQEATSKGGANSGIDFTAQLERGRLQETTQAIYERFMTKLQASGLEVVAPQQLAEVPSFKKMLELSTPTPHEESTWSRGKGGGYNSVMVTPKGMPLVLHEDIDHLMDGWSSVGDPTLSFAGRISLYTTNWPYYDKDLQKEIGAATLHVRLFVPLAVTSTNTWMAANWQRDRSTTTAALRIGERLSRMTVGHNGSIAKITLKTPLFIDGVIGESNLPKPGPTLAGVLFGASDNSASFSLNVDSYFNAVPSAAASVLDTFTQRLH